MARTLKLGTGTRTVPMATKTDDLNIVAREALDLEYGSAGQVESENRVFEIVQTILPEGEFESLERWCIKATSPERVHEALNRVELHQRKKAGGQ